MIITPINPARRVPLLAAALVTAGLTGCMSISFHHPAAVAHTPTPEELAAQKVTDFTTGTDTAIDQVDPDQLRAVIGTPRRMPPVSLVDATTQPTALSPTALAPISLAPTATTQPATDPASAMSSLSVPTPVAPAPKPVAVFHAPEPTVEQAMAVLRRQAAAHPALTTTLALALLDGSEGRAPNPRAIARLSPPDQKLLTDLLAALEGMTPISTSTTLADRATPLVDAAQKWQTDADLTLPKVILASRVESFGVYTPVDPKFPQGTTTTVILYCEVAHFASHRTEDGHYETNLSQQDTLLTSDGLLLWRPTSEEVNDRSLNQRHDFYLVKKITLPDTLAAGKYTLRLSVTDRTVNKIATVTMPIEITPN
jgi:hypothetical protein